MLSAIANRFRLNKLSRVDQFVMSYGGLRGAVAFALALLIKQQRVDSQPMFVTTTIAVIYFTVFLQGTVCAVCSSIHLHVFRLYDFIIFSSIFSSLPGITIKPLVKFLNVKRANKKKPTMNERIHERVSSPSPLRPSGRRETAFRLFSIFDFFLFYFVRSNIIIIAWDLESKYLLCFFRSNSFFSWLTIWWLVLKIFWVKLETTMFVIDSNDSTINSYVHLYWNMFRFEPFFLASTKSIQTNNNNNGIFIDWHVYLRSNLLGCLFPCVLLLLTLAPRKIEAVCRTENSWNILKAGDERCHGLHATESINH